MSKISTLVIALCAFVIGLGVGYVQFSNPAPVQKTTSIPPVDAQPQQSVEKEVHSFEAPQEEAATRTVDISANDEAVELSDAPHKPVLSEPNPQTLEQAQQKIAILQRQLAESEQVILSLSKGADMNEQMQQTFEDQERDEVWAYETETKFNDFIYVAGLSDKIAVSAAQCKSTICSVEFVPLEGVELEPRKGWGQISDTLHAQPFWKQFRRSSSTSSNGRYVLWVERPLPQ